MDVVLELASLAIGVVLGIVLTGLVSGCLYFKTEYDGLVYRVGHSKPKPPVPAAQPVLLPPVKRPGRPKKYK